MWVDLLIIIAAIIVLIRGRETGFARQLIPTLGFFGGLILGAWLQLYVVNWVSSPVARLAVTMGVTLGLATVFLLIGEFIGLHIKYRLADKRLNTVDNAFGAVLGVCSMLAVLWLGAALLANLPYNSLDNSIKSSRIIRGLDVILPSAPATIANLGRLIDPNGFPQVFVGNEPAPQGLTELPDLGTMQRAVALDRLSVVRLEGRGCGGVVEGSGFIATRDMIVTNAHVVAGVKRPVVEDSHGSHDARVVYFDPKLDLAILVVKGLVDQPLVISPTTVSDNTPSAVLGYPGGGAFNARSALVLRQITAGGRDIYGHGFSLRNVYELQADIIPGNSGGPLIDRSGQVIGVIFAQSTSYQHIGYALTTPKVVAALQSVTSNSKSVSSSSCAE